MTPGTGDADRPALPPPPRRIWLLGSPGAGKTTLGGQLAQRLGLPHHQLDAFFWQAGWTRADSEGFRTAVTGLAAGERWIVDGQYHEAHPVLAPRADTVVWLDVPLAVTLWRVTRRTLRRLLGGQALWSGNRETLGSAVGLLTWTVRSHRHVGAVNRPLLVRLAAQGVRTVHAGSVPAALAALLGEGPPAPAPHAAGPAPSDPAPRLPDPDGAGPLPPVRRT